METEGSLQRLKDGEALRELEERVGRDRDESKRKHKLLDKTIMVSVKAVTGFNFWRVKLPSIIVTKEEKKRRSDED